MTKRNGNHEQRTGEGKGPVRADSQIGFGIGFRLSDGVARKVFGVKGGGMKKLTMQTSRTVTEWRYHYLTAKPVPEKEVTGRG